MYIFIINSILEAPCEDINFHAQSLVYIYIYAVDILIYIYIYLIIAHMCMYAHSHTGLHTYFAKKLYGARGSLREAHCRPSNRS